MGRLRGALIAGCLFLAAAGSAQTQPICNLVQITNSSSTPSGPQVVNGFPAIDASGNRVAFSANADLVGQNGDGNQELFLWDAATGLTQITRTSGGLEPLVPTINAAGTRIAFSSTANLVGSNGDGSREIFLWDAATGFTQITNTLSRDNRLPDLNEDGNRIAFSSTADLVGSNGDGNYEIFLWDAATGFTQVTAFPLASTLFSPSINAAGDRVAFFDNGSLGGLFLWDAATGVFRVLGGNSTFPSLNAAGNRIAFSSDANPLGSNSDANGEIFLASCGSLPILEESIPTVSPLGLAALAVLLGLAAAWTLRKRA